MASRASSLTETGHPATPVAIRATKLIWKGLKKMSKRTSNPVLSQGLANKLLLRCMVCDESVEGFYARYGERGTCSGKCMKVQELQPKYPGHGEEAFMGKFNL